MKTVIDQLLLENVDVQMIEVPKGALILSSSGVLQQASNIVSPDGKVQAKLGIVLFVAFNPEEPEKEFYKIYIVGMGTENELPENAVFGCVCKLPNNLMFHIFTAKVDKDGNELKNENKVVLLRP